MVAEAAEDQPVFSDAPKRRRRTKAEIAAAQDVPPKQSRMERWSRLPDIHAWLTTINTSLAAIPAVRPDCLSDPETTQLATAFDNWQASDAKVHKTVEKLLSASPAVALVIVAVGLTLPRLQRHGLIPWLKPEEPKPEIHPDATISREHYEQGRADGRYHDEPWLNQTPAVGAA